MTTFLLYKGRWNVENVQGMLRVIQYFTSLPIEHFQLPASGLPTHRVSSNNTLVVKEKDKYRRDVQDI